MYKYRVDIITEKRTTYLVECWYDSASNAINEAKSMCEAAIYRDRDSLDGLVWDEFRSFKVVEDSAMRHEPESSHRAG